MPGRSATCLTAVSSGSDSMAVTLSHASQVISTSGAQRNTLTESSMGRGQQGYAIAIGHVPGGAGRWVPPGEPPPVYVEHDGGRFEHPANRRSGVVGSRRH